MKFFYKMSSICQKCNGMGRYQVMGVRRCISCAGTGRHSGMVIDLEHNSVKCHICHGTGKESYCEYKTCDWCNGRGRK